MNPFVWRKEHQVAVIVGAILGAVLLEVIGFMYREHRSLGGSRRTNRRRHRLRAAAFAT
jgi:hypothetical protein